jgi:hypothetical protein
MPIYCGSLICGDIVPDCMVDEADSGNAMGILGEATEVDKSCTEGPTTANGQNDVNDKMAWDWRLDEPDTTLCDCDIYKPFMNAADEPVPEILTPTAGAGYGSSLLITGNVRDSNGIFSPVDGLVIYDNQGNYAGNAFTNVDDRCNTRLFCDSYGKIFQLNTKIGLVRLNDGAAVVTPGRFSVTSDPRYNGQAIVAIGLQKYTSDLGTEIGGRPIMDAAVDAQGYIYVVPVVVIPSNNTSASYMAAAKLQLQPGQTPCYSIVRLYDDPPQLNDSHDPARYGLSEIEVDNSGNVYIINAYYNYIDNELSNYLWVYPANNGAPTKVALDTLSGVTGGIPDPIAMFASKKNQMLYLSSGKNTPDATSTKIYGLTTENLALTLSRTVQINNMGHVTAITENPVSGTLWATGLRMFNFPATFDSSAAPFWHAYLAQIPTTSNDPVQATCLDNSSNMAMPYSMTWIPANLTSSIPVEHHYIWRHRKNICRLIFDGDISVPPAGSVKIQEMLAGGQYGQDISSNFSFTVENNSSGKPRILRIFETTACITNATWYAIRNTGEWPGVAKFIVQYPIQKGDANDNGEVTQADQDYVTTGIPNFNCPDDDRRDIDGDRKITTVDHAVMSIYYPSTPVVKPSGH